MSILRPLSTFAYDHVAFISCSGTKNATRDPHP